MISLYDIRAYARRLRLRGVQSLEIQEGDRLVSIRVEDASSPGASSEEETVAGSGTASIAVRSATLGLLRLVHGDRLAIQIEAGDEVAEGQLLALVELDDSLAPVNAPADGVISAVLAAEGQIVDYGMPLFQLTPMQS
jgi:acetyl-CoA carboxylase biotin carboxyl carrier protein